MFPAPDRRWWQDWKLAAAVAAMFLGVGLTMFALSFTRTADSVEGLEPVVDRLDALSQTNSDHLEALRRSQEGIDSLVAYVEELRARAAADAPDDPVALIVELLCSSEDPVRVAACERVRGGGQP
jgi:hypothetical protein